MSPTKPEQKKCNWCASAIKGRSSAVAITPHGKRYFHRLCLEKFFAANPGLKLQQEQEILQRHR